MSYAEFLAERIQLALYRNALINCGVENPTDQDCFDAYNNAYLDEL